ncbi:MAG: Na+/H+ antiporter subunit E [Dermatophilaceae bacterium]
MMLPLLRRALVLSVLWVILVEGDSAYLGYGVAAIPVVVAASLAWAPPAARGTRRLAHPPLRRLWSGAALLGWLLVQSVRGGVDVARRSLARPVRVDPLEVVVSVRLTGEPKATALAVLGLLPGTIVAEVREDEAVVHTLSPDLDSAHTWRELQRRVEDVVSRP